MRSARGAELRYSVSGQLDPASIRKLSSTALKYGFIDREPDLDVLILG